PLGQPVDEQRLAPRRLLRAIGRDPEGRVRNVSDGRVLHARTMGQDFANGWRPPLPLGNGPPLGSESVLCRTAARALDPAARRSIRTPPCPRPPTLGSGSWQA